MTNKEFSEYKKTVEHPVIQERYVKNGKEYFYVLENGFQLLTRKQVIQLKDYCLKNNKTVAISLNIAFILGLAKYDTIGSVVVKNGIELMEESRDK
jgi:hypothetical protein